MLVGPLDSIAHEFAITSEAERLPKVLLLFNLTLGDGGSVCPTVVWALFGVGGTRG